ncbi:MAG: MBL fold metallo-hydrolase [Bacteroidota bacterium]
MTVQFLGAAGTVTGSKYLLEYAGKRIMIDCGLFQGLKELRERNWLPLPIDAATVDCVLLTHGHLDHVGYLPLLVKQGFRGKIHGTKPTLDITRLILLDSAKIHEEDAERANRYQYSKHHPAKPLYTSLEAERVFSFFQSELPDEWITIDPDISFRMRYNGHILGSVFIELKIAGKTIVFSGDLGRPDDPLLFDPRKPEHADVLFIESTYGNTVHPSDPELALRSAILSAAKKNGTIIIPSFAVERTQLIMYYLSKLRAEGQIPVLPVYMDSPMASHVLDVFTHNSDWHKLSPDDYTMMHDAVHLITNPQETERICLNTHPKIVIAAAGMASGGRILTYFEHFLGDSRSTVLLVGHQAEGTRGRALLDGAASIKMRGKFWPVHAEVLQIQGLSAHADRNELTDWLSDLETAPGKIFIVHGEKDGAEGLQKELQQHYNYRSTLPKLYEIYELPLESIVNTVLL